MQQRSVPADTQPTDNARVTRELKDRPAAPSPLRTDEMRFATLVDSITDYAIFVLSPQGTVLTWNQGA